MKEGRLSSGQETLLKVIRAKFQESDFSPSELADAAQIPREEIAQPLSDLRRKGYIKKKDRGLYRLIFRESAYALFQKAITEISINYNDKERTAELDINNFPEELRFEAAKHYNEIYDYVKSRREKDGADNDDLMEYEPSIINPPEFSPQNISRYTNGLTVINGARITGISELLSFPDPLVFYCPICGKEFEEPQNLLMAPSVSTGPRCHCRGNGEPAKTIPTYEKSGDKPYREYELLVPGETEPFKAFSFSTLFLNPSKRYSIRAVVTRRIDEKVLRHRFYILESKEDDTKPYNRKKALEYLGNHDLQHELGRHTTYELKNETTLAALMLLVELGNGVFFDEHGGTGKSTLIKFCTEELMQDKYVDAQNSTAAGLLSGCNADKTSIELGAIPASKYACGIDEIDKEKFDNDRAQLLTVMQEHRVRMDKILKADLEAPASLLMGANDMWRIKKGHGGTQFISRVDVIVKTEQTKIIRQPYDLITKEETADLRNAILYLRAQEIDVPREILKRIACTLNEMQEPESRGYNHLLFMVKALAKLNPDKNGLEKKQATDADFDKALEFYSGLLAKNKELLGIKEMRYYNEGELNIKEDIIKIKSSRDNTRQLDNIIKELVNASQDKLADYKDIMERADKENIEKPDLIIEELKNKGIIYEPKNGKYRLVEVEQ